MLITVMSGKENLPGRQTNFQTYFIPSGQFPGEQQVLFIKAKEPFATKPVRTNGSPNLVSARNGFKPEVVGQWVTQVYDIDEGLLLKAHARVSANGLQYAGGILLQARQGAPLIRVMVQLSGQQQTPFSHAYIEGRFDILTAKDAVEEEAKLTQMDVRSFMPAMRDRVMAVQVLSGETQGRVQKQVAVVENSAGEEVKVVTASRKRALKLD